MYQAVTSCADVACFEDYAIIAYTISTGAVNVKIIGEPVTLLTMALQFKKARILSLLRCSIRDLRT